MSPWGQGPGRDPRLRLPSLGLASSQGPRALGEAGGVPAGSHGPQGSVAEGRASRDTPARATDPPRGRPGHVPVALSRSPSVCLQTHALLVLPRPLRPHLQSLSRAPPGPPGPGTCSRSSPPPRSPWAAPARPLASASIPSLLTLDLSSELRCHSQPATLHPHLEVREATRPYPPLALPRAATSASLTRLSVHVESVREQSRSRHPPSRRGHGADQDRAPPSPGLPHGPPAAAAQPDRTQPSAPLGPSALPSDP